MKEHHNYQKGYALLFSVLFMTVVLSVSLSILLISRKELILSSTAKDSQEAFYAADSAAECALYWDFHDEDGGDGFGVGKKFALSSSQRKIRCNGNVITVTKDVGSYTYNFGYSLPAGTSASVQVLKEYVSKDIDGDGVPEDVLVTTIDSRGYNITGNAPQKLERGVRVTY